MKKMILLTLTPSALLLAACDQTKLPNDLNSLSGTVVEGEYQTGADGTETLSTKAWTGGAGSVVASVLTPGAILDEQRAALGSDGKFTLTLPSVAEDRLVTLDFSNMDIIQDDEACQGTVGVSDPQVRGASLSLDVDADKDGPIKLFSQTVTGSGDALTLNVAGGALLYVDRDVTVKGTQNCTFTQGTFTNDVNLTLRRGWNKLSLTGTVNYKARTGTTTLRSGSFPSDQWVYTGSSQTPAAPLGSQSLMPFLR